MGMKKVYVAPLCDSLEFSLEQILTTSPTPGVPTTDDTGGHTTIQPGSDGGEAGDGDEFDANRRGGTDDFGSLW